MKLEQIRIENYKALRDVTIKDMPDMAVFLGANGSGKSTFFDVFSFLKDCLVDNVRIALQKRGGFREVVSRDQSGPILIELKFRVEGDQPLVTYLLELSEREGKPVVQTERLQYRRGKRGQPWRFLDFSAGQGSAITNEDQYSVQGAEAKREDQKLESADILAIKGLGQFEKFKVAAAFRRLLENWHISDFHISAARESVELRYAEHLSTRGDNLALVAQHLYQNHKDEFDKLLSVMKSRIPGISEVEAAETQDGRVVLRFRDGKFKDPFIARYVSDGTLKMFAYLVLLHDPNPHPLLAIEEPENQLHPDLMAELAEEFRAYSGRDAQVFISTHSPDFVNGVKLDELFWIQKHDGFSRIIRAKDVPNVKSLYDGGDLLGSLWIQKVLSGAGPND